MKIQNLKELQALIRLCQRTGVTSIKIDGIELLLGAQPSKVSKRTLTNDSPDAPSKVEDISTDELTPEQALFYSSGVENN